MSDTEAELAAALARIADLEAQTERRAAELAVVNETALALVAQRDLQVILEAVGERTVEALGIVGLSICVVDPGTDELTFVYWVDEGVQQRDWESRVLRDPLSARILGSGQPLRIGSGEEAAAIGTPFALSGTESYLGVPIPGGDQPIGVLAVGSPSQHAFDEGDERFLVTIASSLGVALENARLSLAQKASEEEYRRLVEALPLAIYKDHADETSTSVYASPKSEEILGYPPERYREAGFFDSVIHPDDRARVASTIEANLAQDDPGIESKTYTLNYRVIAADGRVVWVRDDSWIARDERGRPEFIEGFMIDITEQVEAAAEIRRQKTYFETLVEISPVAIVTMGRDETVSGWNPAASRLFGYEPDEAIGRHIDDLLFDEAGRSEGQAATRLADATGGAQLIGHRRRKDGESVDVEIALVPLIVDGEHTGYYAIYHDITELQAARRDADAANQAKSAFLAAMSHEIRTPMNGVIGMSGLLLATPLNDEQRDFAESISVSGEALLTIINDILDFSKIEAGRFELESIPFDLEKTVRAAADLVRPNAAKKGLELEIVTAGEPAPRLLGDGGRVRQIVLNLLSNAIKFTPQGRVTMTLETVPVDGKWQVRLAVDDTGIGISQAALGRLFQSFTQADASTARRFGGTGLGLAISRRLAELMGGTLEATSSGVEGEGSRFELRFVAAAAPIDLDAAEGRASDAPAASDLPLSERALLVLLAEDDAMNQKLAIRLLANIGVTADIARDGREAVAAARRTPYDVILMDVQMPELDGLEATRQIRSAGLPHRPWIIAMTANAMEGDREASLAAGMDDYITKPIRPNLLLAALEAVPRSEPAAEAS